MQRNNHYMMGKRSNFIYIAATTKIEKNRYVATQEVAGYCQSL